MPQATTFPTSTPFSAQSAMIIPQANCTPMFSTTTAPIGETSISQIFLAAFSGAIVTNATLAMARV